MITEINEGDIILAEFINNSITIHYVLDIKNTCAIVLSLVNNKESPKLGTIYTIHLSNYLYNTYVNKL